MTTLLKKFSIEIDRRSSQDGTPLLRVWLYAELHENASGQRHLSFLFAGDEWYQAFRGLKSTFQDVAHVVTTFGEDWTFFDIPYPRENAGIVPLPYVRLKFPRYACKEIHTRIDAAIGDYDAQAPNEWGDRPKVRLNFDDRLEAWGREGIGTGTVKYEAYDETLALIEKYRGEETFDRCINTIESIARNTTHRPSDVGIVKIGAYGVTDGCTKEFGWNAGSLVGAIINHGSEDEPDWSCHT